MAKRSEKKAIGGAQVSAPAAPKSDWPGGLLLLLLVLLVYSPVGYAGYVWDDDVHVTANPCIVGPLGLKEIWTTDAAQQFPLVLTTFWLEHALWGLAPLPYHLFTVLLHAACAVTLWKVLRNLRIPGAWLGAALWALHPVQVESVAWITETKNTQSGLFFLLAILFHLRWLRSTAATRDYAATLLFAALAMASKSSTVILPFVLILCTWWMEGRNSWRRLPWSVPVFLIGIATAALSLWTARLPNVADNTQWALPMPERLAIAGRVVWFYLGKLLWPYPLSAIYPRWEIDGSSWVSCLPLLAVAGLLLFLWLKRDTGTRPYFFAFTFFLIALLPVAGLVNHFILRYSFVFDHFQYLASMGPLALAGAGVAWMSDNIVAGRAWPRTLLYAGLLATLGLISWNRAWAYQSEETLWTDTLAKNPACWLGYNNLGSVLMDQQKLDAATDAFQKSLSLNPNYAEAHNNLGTVFLKEGRADEALAQFQTGAELNPNYADAHVNWGNALVQKGQAADAIAQYQIALKLEPYLIPAYDGLGNALSQNGQPDDAIAAFQKALQLDPNHAETHNDLGNAYFKAKRSGEAIAQFQRALDLNPNYVDANFNLGIALLQSGQVDPALALFQKTVELRPSHSEAHNYLGIALFQKRQVDQAIAEFKEAVRLNPGNTDAQNNLANIQAWKHSGSP